MDDVTQLFDFIAQHKWVPLAALVIGLVIRLLKSDTKIPITIPSEYRRFAVVVLGIASAALERVIAGTPWKDAALGGVAAVFAAFLAHYFVVDKLRDGKEIAIPGLIVPGTRPGPDAPVTIPPGPMKPPSVPPLPLLLMLLLLAGCGKLFQVLDLAADKAKCIVANQDLPNDKLFAKCAVEPGDVPKYIDLLSESRASTAKALARAGSASDRSDAGPEAGQ